MRLIVGPAGSGKTSLVLHELEEVVRDAAGGGGKAVRLLVPTATLAQHLQNQLAREGLALRGAVIETLSSFVQPWALPTVQAPDSVVYLAVEEAVRRIDRPEFRQVAHLAGFCSSLARTLTDLSSAGCDSQRLRRNLPDIPLGAPFLAVYKEVEDALERRGLALRARCLQLAAARIAAEELTGIRTIWLDGFHVLTDPELEVVSALGRRVEIVLTLDSAADPELRARLAALGFAEEHVPRVRSTPAVAVVRAANMERETEEIARRILEHAAAGRPFREMGVIVRPEAYVPVLRTTFHRFGIPAGFYFDEHLDRHPVARFLAGAINAMLGGWDHLETLAALRLAPRFAASGAMDRFDFTLREQAPNTGLGALKELAHEARAEKLLPLIEEMEALEEWRSFVLLPKDWARRFATLRNLFRPAVASSDTADRELVLMWRTQAAALKLFDEALAEAAAALDPAAEIPLEPFWHTVESVLRLKPLRLGDARRNVVHVLSAPEARQWVLPIVFVCGLVEQQFPQFHRQDAFFTDDARRRLNAAGIRIRTAAEFEREERALFESAISRATMLVTLSYPESNPRGEGNLPSIFLEDVVTPAQEAPAIAPRPRFPREFRQARPIARASLLQALAQKTAHVSPTSLESYLQCAFQYFGSHSLRLRPRPPRPDQRLDFMLQGNIVHEVLARWWMEGGDIAVLFEEVFGGALEKHDIPTAYHTERLRNAMLDDLLAFAADTTWPRGRFSSRTEQEFRYTLAADTEIRGKIDRLDEAADGRAFVFDYKYSNAQNTRKKLIDERLLQAPLYLMGAAQEFGVTPAGMFYVGLKGGVEYAGWSNEGELGSQPMPEDWFTRTRERAQRAVEEIRSGRIEVKPADPDACRFCQCRDICRIEVPMGAVVGA
ncbi:MAG: PD-(D/E)XK nuclease family protein [Bryobacteraceae bacterium]